MLGVNDEVFKRVPNQIFCPLCGRILEKNYSSIMFYCKENKSHPSKVVTVWHDESNLQNNIVFMNVQITTK